MVYPNPKSKSNARHQQGRKTENWKTGKLDTELRSLNRKPAKHESKTHTKKAIFWLHHILKSHFDITILLQKSSLASA